MRQTLARLWRQDAGQDLIEYALLASVFGFAAVVAVEFLSDNMNSTYSSWNDVTQDLWEPPEPQEYEPPDPQK